MREAMGYVHSSAIREGACMRESVATSNLLIVCEGSRSACWPESSSAAFMVGSDEPRGPESLQTMLETFFDVEKGG